MQGTLLLSLGAILGANARFWVGVWAATWLGTGFPFGTFLVNVTGCFLIGLFNGLGETRLPLTPELRLFFAVGFLGAYTTFSSFGFESINLLRGRQFVAGCPQHRGQYDFGLAGSRGGIVPGAADWVNGIDTIQKSREMMQIQGEAQRVTIYIGESDLVRGANLYTAILELLRREGAAGATVTRALAGFGARSRIHTANIETLSADLPIRIEWVDIPERVERLLPQVRRLVNDGLITQETVQVVQYAMGRSQDPLDQPVGNIMRTEVVRVTPATPVAELTTLLLQRGVRALPVVDEAGRLTGIITDGDLLRRANLSARLGLQPELSAAQLHEQLASLQQSTATAADLMTKPVVTVRASDKVRTVVAQMTKHGLKRLPVVNDSGRLVGIVSRLDVFRAVEYQQAALGADEETPHTGRTVAELMHADVPTVLPAARLEEIVQALEQSQRRRAVVVDEQRRVVGIITDGDLLRRSQQGHQPGLLSRLRSLVTGQAEVVTALPDAGETAATLMTAPVFTVHLDTPVGAALQLMTQHGVKRLPVVDAEGRLVGLLGRASVLRGLLEDGV